MISYIQQALQKHNKWIFGILLGIIIVAFVFTIGAAPGVVGKRKVNYFYGKNLHSPRDMQPAIESALVSSMACGYPFYSKEQVNLMAMVRCALLAHADELKIPNPDAEALVNFIKTLPIFSDENDAFSKDKYDEFLSMCEKLGYSNVIIKKALSDDQRIGILSRAVVGDGVIFDYQLAEILTALYSKYDLITADLKYDTFDAKIEVSGDEVEAFYSEHAGRYSRPEMFIVSMVKFEKDEFLNKISAKPSDGDLLSYFEANLENFKDFSNFEDAKNHVLDEYLSNEMQKLANGSADSFACKLYGEDIKLNSDEFNDLLQKFNARKEKVAAYSKYKLPVVAGVPEAALIAVCDMDTSRYYSEPFSTDFGAAVLLVEGRKEARTLTFDEARRYVEKDVFERKKHLCFDDFVARIQGEISSLGQQVESAILSKFKELGLRANSYKKISCKDDFEKFDAIFWETLSSKDGDEIFKTVKSGDDIKCVVVLNKETPPMEEMIKLDNGNNGKRLRAMDRNFGLSEYSNWIVNCGLSKFK